MRAQKFPGVLSRAPSMMPAMSYRQQRMCWRELPVGNSRRPNSAAVLCLERRSTSAPAIVRFPLTSNGNGSTVFLDREQRIRRNSFSERLLFAGRPKHFNTLDLGGISQSEVERHGTLREVTGLSVVIAGVSFGTFRSGNTHFDRRPQSVAIGNSSDQFDFQIMDLLLVR